MFMWIDEWIKSLGKVNRGLADLKASECVHTHKDEYDTFKKRLWKIKEGDNSLYKEMFDLFVKNMPSEIMTISSEIITTGLSLGQESFDNINNNNENIVGDDILQHFFCIIKMIQNSSLLKMYSCYSGGGIIYWDLRDDTVRALSNGEFNGSDNIVAISKRRVYFIYSKLPCDIQDILEEHLVDDIFVGIYQCMADFLVTEFMCALPALWDNLKKDMIDGNTLGLFMYYFVTRDSGFLKMSKFLSRFFNKKAGIDMRTLIKYTINNMAKYSINKKDSRKDDWVDFARGIPNMQELPENILGAISLLEVDERGNTTINASLEEMIYVDDSKGKDRIIEALGYFFQGNSDKPYFLVASMYYLLVKEKLIPTEKKGSMEVAVYSASAFVNAIKYKYNLRVSVRTVQEYVTKLKELDSKVKNTETKKLNRRYLKAIDNFNKIYQDVKKRHQGS